MVEGRGGLQVWVKSRRACFRQVTTIFDNETVTCDRMKRRGFARVGRLKIQQAPRQELPRRVLRSPTRWLRACQESPSAMSASRPLIGSSLKLVTL